MNILNKIKLWVKIKHLFYPKIPRRPFALAKG